MINMQAKNHNCGYTLIQMAIALVVIGVLFSLFAGLYSQYRAQQQVTETYANLETAISSLSTFYANQGRVPCPASITAARGTAGYGSESACTTGAIAALTPGQCAGGICVEDTVRGTLAGTDRRVIVGTVPFRDLQIPEDKSFDGYGSRLVYVVTMSATDEATYSNLKGAIAIRDSNGGSLTEIDGSTLYAVLSPGKTRVGGYNREGGLSSACPTGAGSPLDAENCNDGFDSGTSSATQSVYVSAEKSTATGTTFFDDDVSYFVNTIAPKWRRIPADPENIEDLSDNLVGVGTTTPNVDLTVNSTGLTDSIRIYGQNRTDGTLYTDSICDETGANCFDTLDIAGDNTLGDGMKCPKTTDPATAIYMIGVENGEPKCAEAVQIDCPAGTALYGFMGSAAQCVTTPVISCAAATVTLCSSSSNPKVVNLPAGAEGAKWPADGVSYEPAGLGAGDDNCYKQRFKCSAGNWVSNGTTGTCHAGTPSGAPAFYTQCKNFLGHSGNATAGGIQGFGWNNNVTYQYVSACTTSGYVTQYDVSACTCKDNDTKLVTNAACPAPYTGVFKRKITYTAQCELSGNPVNAADLVPRPDLANVIPNTARTHFGLNAGAPDDSACTCPSSDDWVFNTCPTGFKRKAAPVPASFVGPVKTWPVSQLLGMSKHKYVDASCNVTYDATWNDQCECDTTVTYSHTATACADPVCEVPKTSKVNIVGYPGAGLVDEGWDVFENSRDPMASCTVTSNQIQTGTCQTKGFTWVESHTNGDAYVITPSNEVGKPCSCTEHKNTTATTVPCYRPADASKTLYFCKCQ